MADETEYDLSDAKDRFLHYASDGPNAEYKSLEDRLGLGLRRAQASYWSFIADSVEGMNGFATGTYLYPYPLEIEDGNKISQKLKSRRDQADYDNFARDIMDASWDQIVQSKDLVTRRADQDPEVQKFWDNVDGRGLNIIDFLEYPFRQARMYGTGYVFVDRGQNIGAYAAQSLSEENVPWCYSVPSEHVVDWSFDDAGEIDSVTVIEPTGDDVWTYAIQASTPAFPHNVLTWTKQSWIRFKAIPQRSDEAKTTITNLGYEFIDGGPNDLGIVPMVPLFNDTPGPKRMIGSTEMLDVARLAQTVFNIDSEAREIERKCALFLAMPVKNARDYDSKEVVTGLDNIMVYDGDAGEPRWISPDLEILKKLEERRARIIDSAYKMGHLRALVGHIKTQSGFHAEVEFSKTERRIGRHAAQLETFEMKLADLYQRFVGKEPQDIEVSYPREYGVRDLERQLARSEILISMQLGEKSNAMTLFDLFKTFYPRKSTKELDELTASAVASLERARIEEQQAMLGGAGGAAGASGPQAKPGKGKPSRSERIGKVIERVQANQYGSTMKAAASPEV